MPIVLIGVGAYVYYVVIQPAADASAHKSELNSKYHCPFKAKQNDVWAILFYGEVRATSNRVYKPASLPYDSVFTIVKVVRSCGEDYGQLDNKMWINMKYVERVEN